MYTRASHYPAGGGGGRRNPAGLCSHGDPIKVGGTYFLYVCMPVEYVCMCVHMQVVSWAEEKFQALYYPTMYTTLQPQAPRYFYTAFT